MTLTQWEEEALAEAREEVKAIYKQNPQALEKMFNTPKTPTDEPLVTFQLSFLIDLMDYQGISYRLDRLKKLTQIQASRAIRLLGKRFELI